MSADVDVQAATARRQARLEARARRRAARVNARLERDLPLLVAGGAVAEVTVEQAQAELAAHDRAAEEHLAGIGQNTATEAAAEAAVRDVVLAKLRASGHPCAADACDVLDRYRAHTYPAGPSYGLYFWRNTLAGRCPVDAFLMARHAHLLVPDPDGTVALIEAIGDEAQALTHGWHPPPPTSMPVSRVATHYRMKADPEYRAAIQQFCAEKDAERVARQGGEQLALEAL